MNEFDYEVKQKKDLARSAAHRVCGSKSTKCDLPSDRLTEAQKRALSGPVESISLKKPMDWATFKSLSTSLQTEYMKYLREEYQASDVMMSAMFGVSDAAVNLKRNTLGIKSFGKGRQPSKEAKQKWAEFIAPTPTEEAETAAEEVTAPDPVAPEVEEQPLVVEKVQNPLQQFSMDFCDISTWEELYAYCKQFPNPGKGSYIRIRVDAR